MRRRRTRSWPRILVAIALLPLCIATTFTLRRVINATVDAFEFWVASLTGATCWLLVFMRLPTPVRIYVAGHELTHALWALAFGKRIRSIQVGRKGGHVVLNETNFLITLAPYFFPLYAVLWTLIFYAGHALWGWSRWLPLFHLGLGIAYSFHATLTCHILQYGQPDLELEGFLFSSVIIWLGNVTLVLIALPLLTHRIPVWKAFTWIASDTLDLARTTLQWFGS